MMFPFIMKLVMEFVCKDACEMCRFFTRICKSWNKIVFENLKYMELSYGPKDLPNDIVLLSIEHLYINCSCPAPIFEAMLAKMLNLKTLKTKNWSRLLLKNHQSLQTLKVKRVNLTPGECKNMPNSLHNLYLNYVDDIFSVVLMPSLQLLSLTTMYFLPSIENAPNLRTLILNNCKFKNWSEVCKILSMSSISCLILQNMCLNFDDLIMPKVKSLKIISPKTPACIEKRFYVTSFPSLQTLEIIQ